MKVDIRELLSRAFVAGFTASGEGYNGEYPFDYDAGRIMRETSDDRRAAIEHILATAEVSE